MDWAPDWSGEVAVIAASGPSACREDVEHAARAGARIIAINCAWTLAPKADVLYGCDLQWWRCEAPGYGQDALRHGPRLKVSGHREACDEYGINYVHLVPDCHEILTEPGKIGRGGNSGFQAINLAIQFGCKRVLLLGFDMDVGGGAHFHANHPAPMANPNDSSVTRWRGFLQDAVPSIKALGVEVINCSRNTLLTCFDRMPITQALEVPVMRNASPKPKIKIIALVRDKHGRPKVDDPSSLPDEIVAMLTPDERRDLGLEV